MHQHRLDISPGGGVLRGGGRFPAGRTEGAWLALLLTLGLAARVYAAFFYTLLTHTDIAINALMVKHIAEGRHFPIFFYGQAYMGPLETYVGAFFYRLLPHSLFPALLGSALVSFLALPVFYLWVRLVFGVRAALFGLTLMVIGPPVLFYFNIYLGYPVALFTGLAGCGLTALILKRHSAMDPARCWPLFAALGFVAGLGWWNNTLSAAFLIPCALLLAVFVPWRRLLALAPVGLLGFAVGAAPWILHAVRHADALRFVGDVSVGPGGDLASNLRVAIGFLPGLFNVDPGDPRPLSVAAR